MVLVDRDTLRIVEPERLGSLQVEPRQEPLPAQRIVQYSFVANINIEDAIVIVIDRKTIGEFESAWPGALVAELGHERAIVARECLHSLVAEIQDIQEASMVVERQASWGI